MYFLIIALFRCSEIQPGVVDTVETHTKCRTMPHTIYEVHCTISFTMVCDFYLYIASRTPCIQ